MHGNRAVELVFLRSDIYKRQVKTLSALQVADLLCQQVATRNDLTQPVVKHASPAELERVFQKVCFPPPSSYMIQGVGVLPTGLDMQACLKSSIV